MSEHPLWNGFVPAEADLLHFDQLGISRGANCPAAPLLVDVTGAATLLTVSPRTIWRLVENKQLPAPVHIGRLARWRTTDVVAFVDGLVEQVK